MIPLPWFDLAIVASVFLLMFRFVIPFVFPNHKELARAATGGKVVPQSNAMARSHIKAEARRARHAAEDY